MLIGVVASSPGTHSWWGGQDDDELAHPLLVTFLPLVGAASSAGRARRRRRSWPQCALGRAVDVARVFLISLLLWVGFDPTQAGFQFVEQACLDCRA
jgi:NADH:ubiquinone oxidoreductase subunit 4 (subunit M)